MKRRPYTTSEALAAAQRHLVRYGWCFSVHLARESGMTWLECDLALRLGVEFGWFTTKRGRFYTNHEYYRATERRGKDTE
jgi:hypothetical protein